MYYVLLLLVLYIAYFKEMTILDAPLFFIRKIYI